MCVCECVCVCAGVRVEVSDQNLTAAQTGLT